jgi:hypothetical protein
MKMPASDFSSSSLTANAAENKKNLIGEKSA